MSISQHNRAEFPALAKLRADTSWYLSEKAGHDLTLTTAGRAQIETAMAEIITTGWGAWMAAQIPLAPEISITSAQVGSVLVVNIADKSMGLQA